MSSSRKVKNSTAIHNTLDILTQLGISFDGLNCISSPMMQQGETLASAIGYSELQLSPPSPQQIYLHQSIDLPQPINSRRNSR